MEDSDRDIHARTAAGNASLFVYEYAVEADGYSAVFTGDEAARAIALLDETEGGLLDYIADQIDGFGVYTFDFFDDEALVSSRLIVLAG